MVFPYYNLTFHQRGRPTSNHRFLICFLMVKSFNISLNNLSLSKYHEIFSDSNPDPYPLVFSPVTHKANRCGKNNS